MEDKCDACHQLLPVMDKVASNLKVCAVGSTAKQDSTSAAVCVICGLPDVPLPSAAGHRQRGRRQLQQGRGSAHVPGIQHTGLSKAPGEAGPCSSCTHYRSDVCCTAGLLQSSSDSLLSMASKAAAGRCSPQTRPAPHSCPVLPSPPLLPSSPAAVQARHQGQPLHRRQHEGLW